MSEESTMPSDAEPGKKSHKGAKITAWTLGAVVVVAGGAYVGSALLTKDKLPAELSIEGVDVSGQNAEEAEATLTKAFAEREAAQLQLSTESENDSKVTITPKDAGLGVDVTATVSKYTGLSWDPSIIWSRLTGSQDGSAETTVDQAKLTSAVEDAAKDLDSKAVEGQVSFNEGKAELKEPESGVKVDVDATAEALREQWLNADGSIKATASTDEPEVSADDWKKFVEESADPLVSGEITVDDGSNQATLSAEQLGNAASTEVKDGSPSLKLDQDVLLKDTVSANPKMKSTGKDATFKLTGKAGSAKPEIVPAKEGRGIKAEDLSAAVLKASTSEDRKATVKPTVTQPTVSTAAAKKWKLQVTSEFATVYPTYDTTRTKNLVAGSAKVSGTVVEPGEEFNLANEFGPVTAANGYYSSGVVENGLSTKAMGGGLSQIATMSYNAGYLSGMEILEHRAHSRWFDRYPEGRESTYWEGQINVRWKNDTPAPVAVEMWVSDEKVHMRTWGVKYWDVKTTTSDHYNLTSPRAMHSNAPGCVPERTGINGFTVDVSRTRQAPGKEPETQKDTTTYTAWPNVTCG
ncbi:MAG: VanW family protein [Galactobacter sp.]|uniref:VanW family protein n=1 Tax=Galactobacter sp. TaxID=2676125 RepID=UPI0025B7F96C|nr:VanW family protein [Galactobacter sp.]